MTGSTKFWTWVLTGVLTVLLVGFVNVFLDEIDAEWDLTEDKRYTLPEEAKAIAAQLTDECTVQVLLSDPLPTYLDHIGRSVQNRLEEFSKASGGKILFEFVDPEDESEEFRDDLEERKIKPQQLTDFVEGKRVQGNYYMWLVMNYGDREENFHLLELRQALLQEIEFLRMLPFQIAAKLVKMIHPDRQVGILSEKKSPPAELQQVFGRDATDGLAMLRKRIESHLTKPSDVTIKSGNPVPESIHTLVVHRPDNFDERAVYALDQALMSGKHVILLLDNHATIEVDRISTDFVAALQAMQNRNSSSSSIKARPLNHGLTEWLAHFGIKVEPGYLESVESCQTRVPVQKIVGRKLVLDEQTWRYPGLVLARERSKDNEATGQFSDGHAVMSGLGLFCMAWPVPMQLDPSTAGDHPEIATEVVVRSSEDTFAVQPERDMLPVVYKLDDQWDTPTERRSYPLVVEVSGQFRSFFAGKEYGDESDKRDRPPRRNANGEMLPALPNEAPKLDGSVGEGRLWVFADSDFADDMAYVQIPAGFQRLTGPAGWSKDARAAMPLGQTGLVNAIDILTVGGELIAIRKPALKDRSLDDGAMDEDRAAIQFKTIWLAPILLVVLGVAWGFTRWSMTRIPSPTFGNVEPAVPPSDVPPPAGSGGAAANPKEHAS